MSSPALYLVALNYDAANEWTYELCIFLMFLFSFSFKIHKLIHPPETFDLYLRLFV